MFSTIAAMNVDGVHYRSIWLNDDGWSVSVIDQTVLPHGWSVAALRTVDEAARAIEHMVVRGAPLIGATAAYGLCLALREAAGDDAMLQAAERLRATRPTAVNLAWALDQMLDVLRGCPEAERAAAAYRVAHRICEEDVAANEAIGNYGRPLIEALRAGKPDGAPVNILTHCNAGWLATVDRGTALSPVYAAHDAGVPLHIWVDETRPRNQGASLTAWELQQHGVPHTVIVDNAGGHLMQHGRVDCCIVGSDRTTATGDVCNKIGTYLKALAAHDNDVPFYVAVPSSTIDLSLRDGVREIPIEERSEDEVSHIAGCANDGTVQAVRVIPEGSHAGNWAFDVTPARLVTALITEHGTCTPSELEARVTEARGSRAVESKNRRSTYADDHT